MDSVAPSSSDRRPIADFVDLLQSELCKLRSVRSTYWAYLSALVFNVGLAALVAIVLPEHLTETLDATRLSLGGVHLSQMAVGVLGVLVISSEYDTDMIYSSFSAVPRRRRMLAAKAIVFGASALVIGIIASIAAFVTFQALVSDDRLRSSLGDPGVLRAIIGGGMYLAALGLLGLGLGAILRSGAGAIAALFGVLFVPPLVLELLPHSWQATGGPYVPLEAGSQIYFLRHESGSLGPWSGFGVFCLYAAVTLGAAFVLIDHRDAKRR